MATRPYLLSRNLAKELLTANADVLSRAFEHLGSVAAPSKHSASQTKFSPSQILLKLKYVLLRGHPTTSQYNLQSSHLDRHNDSRLSCAEYRGQFLLSYKLAAHILYQFLGWLFQFLANPDKR